MTLHWRRLLTRTVLACVIAFWGAAAQAMSSDSDKSEGKAAGAFEMGRKAIAAQDWTAAIEAMTKVADADPKNADAQNYLGYANRKLGKLDEALTHYGNALAINPKHRGAHEYIGEAYLLLGDVAKAEQHLASLDDICLFGCAEYDQLKKAIADYKAKRSSS